PQQLVQTPQMQSMPIEILEALLKQEAGIELSQVREVVMLVGFTGPPVPSFVVRFSEPCRQEAIIEALTDGEGDKIDDRSTYRVKGHDPLLAVLPEDRTLVGVSGANLADMFTEKKPTSPLLEHLRSVNNDEVLSAVVVVEPIRPLLKGAIAQLPPLPPQYQ